MPRLMAPSEQDGRGRPPEPNPGGPAHPAPAPTPHRAAYLAPYQEAVDRVGPAFESLLWRNREWQRRRFEVLAEVTETILPGGIRGRTVADLGCGRADFAAWMHEAHVQYGRYIGIDAIEQMVDAGRQVITAQALPDATTVLADFAADPTIFKRLTQEHGVEVIVFGGALNTFQPALASIVLERAWEAVSALGPDGGLVFNFLSDRYPNATHAPDDIARRMDTVGLLTWALRCTPRVVFRHEYLQGHDATIGMRPIETARAV